MRTILHYTNQIHKLTMKDAVVNKNIINKLQRRLRLLQEKKN